MAKRDEPWRIERLLERLRQGHMRKVAYAAAGVDESTFRAWLVELPGFRERVAEAEMEAAGEMEDRVRSAAEKDWKAAAWWLERRMAAIYGRMERLEQLQVVELLRLEEELAQEGIHIPLEQMVVDMQRMLKSKQPKQRLRALPVAPESLPPDEVG